jgi:hexaprenyl-diphosphate synthase
MAAAYSLHRSVVSLGSREADSRVDHGNKLATLMGDLLLARSTQKLSQLKHNPVTELMSNALADFAESEVLGLPLSATPLDPVRPTLDLWLRRTSLGLGSLMAHSCQSSAMLAGHDEQLRDFSFTLGLNLGITLQVSHNSPAPLIPNIYSF